MKDTVQKKRYKQPKAPFYTPKLEKWRDDRASIPPKGFRDKYTEAMKQIAFAHFDGDSKDFALHWSDAGIRCQSSSRALINHRKAREVILDLENFVLHIDYVQVTDSACAISAFVGAVHASINMRENIQHATQ
jgi:hypothetical protein